MSPAFQAGAHWILGYFEDAIKQGGVFNADETVQIGWMIVKLKIDKHGDLEIWEPQFDSVPIKWTRGANNTFRFLTLQKEICDQVGVDPEYPSLQQSGIISPGFLDDARGFYMNREAQTGNHSGWLFTQPGYQGAEGSHRSLFEIAIAHPLLIPFLALPAGTTVDYDGSKATISYGATEISSDENAFLNKLLQSPAI